ncbi:MAG: leucine-rich repeat domain-containing protein [Bacteroides sp.]|nr:leucine-rich repeat domain-containing protein [Bacillota bacterium]MCM1393558.1 leucine-rich repeat domain-containing protein [[Eubacterium] siraeum]MCM1455084.1 leucine-rich repeat domain-containing protein [Bacteroides sp.]
MKKVWKGSKTTLIILIVVIAVLSALAVGGVTYAIWTEVSHDTQEHDLPIDPYNPSEKYIIFRGLDAQGDFSDVTHKEVKAYAAVGYKGLVAEVVIPATHNDKPVVKVCNSNIDNDLEYRFKGNPIITSLQIPASVTEVATDACSGMDLLEKIEILGDSGNVKIGDFAFANCPRLSTFNCEREIVGTRDSYLLGSNL